MAVASFVVSLVLQHTLYRWGSGDADEAAYVMQARMLLDGRLTLDAASVEPFFRPWLTGEVDGRVFTKYLPGWPAALALSQLLFGTMTVAPAVVAAAWVVGAYRLGKALFDAPAGVVAALLVACSPLVLLHTALPLAYAATAAAATLASAALVRGVLTGSRRSLCLAGAGFGYTVLVRPLDGVLVALGCLLFVAASLAGRQTVRWRRLPWAVLGGLPFVAVLLAYNAHVTGSPLRLPIPASDPLDTFGFGERRIMIGEPTFLFTRQASIEALVSTVKAVPGWVFGGIPLVVLAAVGLLAPGRRAARLMLAGTVVLVLGTYLFWWGSAFAAPGLREGLGPHYHLAAFTSLLLLAARGAVTAWTVVWSAAERRGAVRGRGAGPWRARLAKPLAVVAVLLVGAAVTAPSVSRKVDVQESVNGGTAFVHALVPDDLAGPAVVVVSPGEPSRFTQVPFHTLRNDPDLAGDVVYAADLGAATVALPDRMPGRALYRLRPAELLDAAEPFSYGGSFVQLRVVEARAVTLTVEVTGDAVAGRAGEAYVRLGGTVRTLPLTTTGTGSRTATVAVGLAPGTVLGPNGFSLLGATLPDELVVGFAASGFGDQHADQWEQRFPLGTAGPNSDVVRVLAPGVGWQVVSGRYDGDWVQAHVEGTLDVTVAPAG